MGMFMASVAFRPEPQRDWAVIKPQIESMFKGMARALKQAVAIDAKHADEIPSTKGVL